jgi:sodium/bile acid cotransporter 7
MKLKIDSFVLAIILTVILAYIFPQLGKEDSKIPLDLISSIGISLIFFFYGLKLSPEKIKTGLRNWKLHVLVQTTTFLIFPLLVLGCKPFFQAENAEMIWLAFLFLAALPSTVSSSVVMVSMAKGNVPAAIFNASISGLIGILITPLWMGLFVESTSKEFSLSSIYFKLLTEILLPILLGLILQRYLGNFALKYPKQLSNFDKTIILLIIYKSFAHSFLTNVFSSVSWKELGLISIAVLAIFYFVYFLTGFIARKLKFRIEDQITAQFCGTKKSLVHGTVFSKILFTELFPIGIMLLPLMIFHAIQIFIISIIATKLGKREASSIE